MDSVILKRGNSTIHLEKSDHSIGLRAFVPEDIDFIIPEMNEKLQWIDTNKELSGFKIINFYKKGNIEKLLDDLRAHENIHTGTHVYHTPDSNVPFVPTGKITLRFRNGVSEEEKQVVLSSYKLLILESRQKENLEHVIVETYIVSVTQGSMNPLKVAYELQQFDILVLAEPDLSTPGKLTEFELPPDPFLADQWHLQNSGTQFNSSLGLKVGADARVVKAWQKMGSLGDESCIVAIIDDGFDINHPDLNSDGKVVAPWDFQTRSPDPRPKSVTPFDGDYHGTACAGIAIGISNNIGVLGVAPACRLMPIRWSGTINDDTIEAWFDYVRVNGAWIVNCSWGTVAANNVLSTRQNEAIEDCARRGRNGLGCVIVFASGNANRNINDPEKGHVNGFAIHPDVISVAASNSLDERSEYSNFGNEITVCAPSDGHGGRGLLTCDMSGKFKFQGIEYAAGYAAGDYTKMFGGTSGAAPVVAGVCALILSYDRQLTAMQVKEIVQRSARQIGDLSTYKNGHSILHGYGCINAEEAINYINNLINK